jgi:hypothetical protein
MAEAQARPSTSVDDYRAAVQGIRDTAKWVLGTLGGVGAVLVTGLGLSSLANLTDAYRLFFAIIGLVVALMGLGWAIAQTAAVLRPSTTSLADVVAAERKGEGERPTERKGEGERPRYLRDVLAARPGLLAGLADDFGKLQTKTDTVMKDRVEALEAHYADPSDTEKATTAQAAQARAQLYGQKVDAVVARAAYGEVTSRLSVLQQLAAGACVALGVGLFAVMLALPTDPPPDLHGSTLKKVDLSGTRLVGADFAGMKLTKVNLRQAVLRGADFSGATLNRVDLEGANVEAAKFDKATWIATTCPDGTSSAEAGNRCQQHLEPR